MQLDVHIACMFTYIWRSDITLRCLYSDVKMLPLLFETDFLIITWVLLIRLDWGASRPPGTLLSLSHSAIIASICHHT